MKLFWKSFGPINMMASLHADGCAHLKFAGKGTGITVIPVSGPDDPKVKDLEDRAYPVRLAPCLKKQQEVAMPSLAQLVRETRGEDAVDNALDKLRTVAIDLAENLRDFYTPQLDDKHVLPFVGDVSDLIRTLESVNQKWKSLQTRYHL